MKSTDVSWSDTRRILRKDHRWESAALLERHEKEKLFEEHVEVLTKRKKEHFRQLLDETTMVSDMLKLFFSLLFTPHNNAYKQFLKNNLIT